MYNKDLKRIRILPASEHDPFTIRVRKNGRAKRISCKPIIDAFNLTGQTRIPPNHIKWNDKDIYLEFYLK